MTTIIHLADLHIDKANLDYCDSILKEVTARVKALNADYLFLGGDLFDSTDDFYSYWNWFCDSLSGIPDSCQVYGISGNHDLPRSGAARLISIPPHWNYISGDKPEYFDLGEFDLVCCPHLAAGHPEIEFSPDKKRAHRLLLSHGIPECSPIAGLDRSAMILSDSLLSQWQIDTALLGHIHKQSEFLCGSARIIFPGSARVWRKGETGAHGIYVVQIGDDIRAYSEDLVSAGKFLHQSVMLIPGEKPFLPSLENPPSCEDWLHFTFSGVVRREEDLEPLILSLKKWWSNKVRKISFETDHLIALEDQIASRVVSRFIRHWKQVKPDDSGSELVLWREGGVAALREIISSGNVS